MMTSIGSKQELIENSFDICTTKFKLDIFAFLYSCPVNPIDVITLLMRAPSRGRQCFIYLVYRNLWVLPAGLGDETTRQVRLGLLGNIFITFNEFLLLM